ncbi:MAG: response regulator transcription factor [Anaerolineae bacterium]|nr:response regulator transcription factor [Anaerolineae bacterium]
MTAKKIKLFIVDDHILFRKGLTSLILDMPEFCVAGEAEDGIEALKKIRETKPDIVLLDVNMPKMDGIATLKALRELEHPLKIVMLTISQNDEDLFGAIKAGADGYLLKNTEPGDLRKALLRLAQGAGVLSPEVTQTVLRSVSRLVSQETPAGMSERELDVLNCLANGLNTREIASALFISENTVKTHIRHILEKLDASNRTEAVSKAIQTGIIHRRNR